MKTNKTYEEELKKFNQMLKDFKEAMLIALNFKSDKRSLFLRDWNEFKRARVMKILLHSITMNSLLCGVYAHQSLIASQKVVTERDKANKKKAMAGSMINTTLAIVKMMAELSVRNRNWQCKTWKVDKPG